MNSVLFAYMGPGVGAGVFAVIGGILLSVVMAIVAVVWYPMKRLLGKRSQTPPEVEPVQDEPS